MWCECFFLSLIMRNELAVWMLNVKRIQNSATCFGRSDLSIMSSIAQRYDMAWVCCVSYWGTFNRKSFVHLFNNITCG